MFLAAVSVSLSTLVIAGPAGTGLAQVEGPTMLHPGLAVRTVAEGLVTPTSLAFLGAEDILVAEKNTGRVQRVVGGQIRSTVLDLVRPLWTDAATMSTRVATSLPSRPSS